MSSKKFNATALGRLYCLKRPARERAVADRAGGGGPSPYRHALSQLHDVSYEGRSLGDAIKLLEKIKDPELSDASVDLLRRMKQICDSAGGKYVRPCKGFTPSPTGIFEIVAKSHISIETETELINYIFWNNKTSELYLRPAEMMGTLFIDAIQPDLLKPHLFRFVNLRTDNVYDILQKTDIAALETTEFLLGVERMMTAAKARRAA